MRRVEQKLVELVVLHIGAVHHLEAGVQRQTVGGTGHADVARAEIFAGVQRKNGDGPDHIRLKFVEKPRRAGNDGADILHRVVDAEPVCRRHQIPQLRRKGHPVALLKRRRPPQTRQSCLISLHHTPSSSHCNPKFDLYYTITTEKSKEKSAPRGALFHYAYREVHSQLSMISRRLVSSPTAAKISMASKSMTSASRAVQTISKTSKGQRGMPAIRETILRAMARFASR